MDFNDVNALSPYLYFQLGSIPYAEVFGEKAGFATVTETLSYLESYAQQEALQYLRENNVESWSTIQLPYYVFDSSILTDVFKGYYKLPCKIKQ